MATLLQMNDAKADLEGKGVKGDEVFHFFYQQQSYFHFLTTDFSLVSLVNVISVIVQLNVKICANSCLSL